MSSEPRKLDRPAFYALATGGWRDLVTLLHPPYTAWHLSYVVFGAAIAPTLHGGRLLATLAAFFLAVGVSAHALDELNGRPLQTTLRRRTLVGLAVVGLGGAVGIGIAGAILISPLLAPLVPIGAVLVVGYNLELAGGRIHNDWGFAIAWGGFPAFTGYFAQTLAISLAGVLVAIGCCLLSAVQRRLSTPVRQLRRRTAAVTGEQELTDGTTVALTKAGLAAPLEDSLSALSIAVVVLALGLLAARL